MSLSGFSSFVGLFHFVALFISSNSCLLLVIEVVQVSVEISDAVQPLYSRKQKLDIVRLYVMLWHTPNCHYSTPTARITLFLRRHTPYYHRPLYACSIFARKAVYKANERKLNWFLVMSKSMHFNVIFKLKTCSHPNRISAWISWFFTSFSCLYTSDSLSQLQRINRKTQWGDYCWNQNKLGIHGNFISVWFCADLAHKCWIQQIDNGRGENPPQLNQSTTNDFAFNLTCIFSFHSIHCCFW